MFFGMRDSSEKWMTPLYGPSGCPGWSVGMTRVARAGRYEVKLRLAPAPAAGSARFLLGNVSLRQKVNKGAAEVTFPATRLAAGPGRLEAFCEFADSSLGVHYVDMRKVE